MTRLLSLALAVVVFTSCEKNPVSEPVMQYTNLGNAEVKYQSSKSIDVDGDNKSDFFFELLPVVLVCGIYRNTLQGQKRVG